MLELGDLHKRFGDHEVLRGLSLAVEPGEMYGFCGANGAGKTTAMRIALGILTADSGAVRWNGRAVGPAERERIGYMPEERGLYGRMRPVEQLVYLARLSGAGRVEARRRAEAWIERLDVRMRPRDTVDMLSLGNQQRIQLIAALIHRPDVLILDEPFSGLDPVATDALAAALDEIRRDGVPVLFSSHQLDLVERLCDRVGIVRDGVLVAEGGVPELRGAHGGRRVALTVDGADPGWTDRLPVRRVVSADGDRAVAEIDRGQALDEVVAAAQRAGSLSGLTVVEPSLTEIFRTVVTA